MTFSHTPVMARECVDALEGRADGIYLDATVGLGGHGKLILERLPQASLIGLDLDRNALEIAGENLKQFGNRATLLHGNYADAINILAKRGISAVSGILFDLGASSLQFDARGRGFSFNADAPLDMRFNDQAQLSAHEIVNGWDFERMERVFREYGEERNSKRIASEIISRRRVKKIETTLELSAIAEKINGGRQKIHPATRIFQALRIAVNGEIDNVRKIKDVIGGLLEEGAKGAVLSFHSLEDRIIKHSFKEMAAGGGWIIETKKPLAPSPDETGANPRARSAKLRVVRRRDEK